MHNAAEMCVKVYILYVTPHYLLFLNLEIQLLANDSERLPRSFVVV